MNVPKGVFICEYAGEVIAESAAQPRDFFNLNTSGNGYQFNLNHFDPPADDGAAASGDGAGSTAPCDLVIEAGLMGNVARFINHVSGVV